MKFSTTSAVALVAAVAVANPVPAVEQRDATPWFSVTKIAYAGTGCPAGTVTLADFNDWNAITLRMNGYVASVGPGTPITESRKNCQINLSVAYPQGWQYSVVKARYVGSASLNAGVTGQQRATYYFSGKQNQVSKATNFVGPLSGPYDITDIIALDQIDWSECGNGVGLNINSELRLNNWPSRTATGYMSTNFEQIHELQWRKC